MWGYTGYRQATFLRIRRIFSFSSVFGLLDNSKGSLGMGLAGLIYVNCKNRIKCLRRAAMSQSSATIFARIHEPGRTQPQPAAPPQPKLSWWAALAASPRRKNFPARDRNARGDERVRTVYWRSI